MIKKIGFIVLWLGFVTYAFFLSPPEQPGTFELIKNLSTGRWEGINPLIVSLFNIMGVFPMIYSCVLFIDGRAQKISAAPFALVSFGVGAFAILPYLFLREPNAEFPGQKNWLIKILDSRLTGVLLFIGAAILVSYGLVNGNWGDFAQQWQTNRFIHVMSLDFCLLCLLFPALLGDDMARRGIQNQALFWTAALIPLFGALFYLCVRSPLPEKNQISTPQPAST
ncbi:hypothetical protein [Aliterella atlantica]|uniref:DUF2834 domain-containing protein n=1 Tax=Aliterella atlantica CENA595 TaxID=1618023 RepID=A0A0D8ZWE2_9CYAN|nr:hypothetical protein [Aliterella atlantica]KJH72744.1 hypothetical protein UH38_04055 [Aliterella atlantica CENA595]